MSKIEKKDPEEVVKHWPPKWLYVLVAVAPFSILELIDKLNELGMLPWATAFIKWWVE
ncbi:hypothetical protein [Eubacterium oxidoreducens]|uniref:hypothetical protein n=1 Tax=Eubacterium oxidoreducens TaxID=1732 RepID=UPI00159FE811|nr:hypothetical protein [Eubacterium oxidoreducens]